MVQDMLVRKYLLGPYAQITIQNSHLLSRCYRGNISALYLPHEFSMACTSMQLQVAPSISDIVTA